MANFNVGSLLGRLNKAEKEAASEAEPQKKILYVCTGNIARSASAKYLSRQLVGPESSWIFDSAGTGAVVGSGVAPHIDRELASRGVDFSDHKARQIKKKDLEEAALVLVMEKEHLDWLVGEWPQYRTKVHLLGQMARLRQQAGRRVDPIAFMLQHEQEPTYEDRIEDPYRKGAEAAKVAVERIEHDLSAVIPWLGK